MLYLVAAWVVIVAGIVFILSMVFWTGAMVVGYDHDGEHHHPHHGMMWAPDGPGGPGGPGQFGPGGPGPMVTPPPPPPPGSPPPPEHRT